MTVRLDVKPERHGWARVELAIGDQVVRELVSYVFDGLSELPSAIAAAIGGVGPAAVSFLLEPGEQVWLFEPSPTGRVTVTVREFGDFKMRARGAAASGGRTLLAAECSARAIASACVAAFDRALRTLGGEAYATHWCHPFPGEAVDQLRTIVRDRPWAHDTGVR